MTRARHRLQLTRPRLPRAQASTEAGRQVTAKPAVSARTPDPHMLDLAVTVMAASPTFYRRLGVAVPGTRTRPVPMFSRGSPAASASSSTPPDQARPWHAAWRADPASVNVVIGFSPPTRHRPGGTPFPGSASQAGY